MSAIHGMSAIGRFHFINVKNVIIAFVQAVRLEYFSKDVFSDLIPSWVAWNKVNLINPAEKVDCILGVWWDLFNNWLKVVINIFGSFWIVTIYWAYHGSSRITVFMCFGLQVKMWCLGVFCFKSLRDIVRLLYFVGFLFEILI